MFATLLAGTAAAKPVLPQLQTSHGATQLTVDGQPYLIHGGELDNSSASTASFMQPVWSKVAAIHMNTVLAQAYWELIEPIEG